MTGVATAVIPYRGDPAGIRARNANAVLRWLDRMDIPAILAESAATPDERIELQCSGTRVFQESRGPFSKAAAVNFAAVTVDRPVLALVDADTFVRPEAFLACVNRIAARDEVIRPFGRLVELDSRASQQFIEDGAVPVVAAGERDDRRGGEHIPLCGGIVILPTELFFDAGGMDESFIGWGGEDDAFAAALTRIGATIRVLAAEPAFHLWHERSEAERYTHPNYAQNAARAAWWQGAPEDEVRSEIARMRAELRAARRG